MSEYESIRRFAQNPNKLAEENENLKNELEKQHLKYKITYEGS